MELKFTKKNKTLFVFISGEIDHHTAKELREKIDHTLLQMGGKNILFDFQEVIFMDSSGIGMMIGRYKQVNSLGGRIGIVCPNEKIKEIIQLSGLSGILRTFPAIEDALSYIEGRDCM